MALAGLEVSPGRATSSRATPSTTTLSGGIFVDADGGSINGNRGRRNGVDGLHVSGIDNTVSNNSFEDNGNWNICVELGNTDGGGNREPPITFVDCF